MSNHGCTIHGLRCSATGNHQASSPYGFITIMVTATSHNVSSSAKLILNTLLPEVMFFMANITPSSNPIHSTSLTPGINSSSWLEAGNNYNTTVMACNPSQELGLLGCQCLIQ